MQIKYHKNFLRNFKKLSPKFQDLYYLKIDIFYRNKFDAQLKNHGLKGKYLKKRSININGDVRAIYIEKDEEIIFILIGTHSDLYKH